LPGHLAEEVPERDVDRRVAALLGAGRAVADIGRELLGNAVDGERAAAEKLRCRRLVDIGLDRLRREEGLAEANEALIGVDAQPDEVGELVEPDRLDGGDLHCRLIS
jgi:hypothetical protein